MADLSGVKSLFRGGAFPASLDEEQIAALQDHGLAPLIYAKTRNAQLRKTAIDAAAVEALHLADLREVLDAFERRGITPLILKGTALAYELFEAPELRPRTDTDLLIRRDDLEAVREAMQSLQFEERLTSGDELGVRQHGFSRSDRYGVAHAYDIHLDISNSAVFAGALRYDDLLPRAIVIDAIAPAARGLSHADALLLACIHRIAHHYDNDRLIWLYDIHLLRERMTSDEHRQFWQRAADARVVGVCMHSIALADAWFSRTIHDRAEDHLDAATIARDEPSRAFLVKERSRAGLLIGDITALPDWTTRLTRLWQLAFPPRSFMRQSFGSATPVAYTWRMLRGVARLFRRVVPE